jgi:hypothetical protein
MQPGMDTPTVDNAEMVYISSLALLKVKKQKSHTTNVILFTETNLDFYS